MAASSSAGCSGMASRYILCDGPSVSILHAHDGHAVGLAAVVARCTGIPLVATRRVDFHLQRPWPWRQAESVIAVSAAVRAVLLEDGIPSEKVRVVHSGIDVDATGAVTPADIRSGLGLPPGSTVVVNVAALVAHKDHRTLIAAAAVLGPRFPDLHWVVAGAGPLRARLLREIDRAGMTGRIHLLGAVPDPLPLIAGADVFVMSSREEGLGTSVLDALALGVPVVATSAGGLPEVVGQEAGLLCPVGQPAQLAAAVALVLEQPEVARRLRTAGPAQARRFSFQRMATELVSVYRSFTQMLESK